MAAIPSPLPWERCRGRPIRPPGSCPTRGGGGGGGADRGCPWRPGPLGHGGQRRCAGPAGPAPAQPACQLPAVLGPERVAWLADQARVRFTAREGNPHPLPPVITTASSGGLPQQVPGREPTARAGRLVLGAHGDAHHGRARGPAGQRLVHGRRRRDRLHQPRALKEVAFYDIAPSGPTGSDNWSAASPYQGPTFQTGPRQRGRS
jgi:hypothetical protein